MSVYVDLSNTIKRPAAASAQNGDVGGASSEFVSVQLDQSTDDVHGHSHSHSHAHAHSHGHGHGHGHDDDDDECNAAHDEHEHDDDDDHGHHHHHHAPTRAAASTTTTRDAHEPTLNMRHLLHALRGDRISLAIYTAALILFVFVEFWFGMYVDSLAFIADAWHSAFGAGAIAIRLVARVSAALEKKRAGSAPPSIEFGAGRTEILAGFALGVSSIFVALFLIFECLEHFLSSCFAVAESSGGGGGGVAAAADDYASMLAVAVCGIAFKALGVVFFYEHMRTRAEATSAFEYPGDVWRHIVVDAICSVALLLNCHLMTSYAHGVGADALLAFLITALIILSALPVCKSTGRILLHTTPSRIEDALAKAARDACTLDGVLELKQEHYLTVAPGEYAGSLVFRVSREARHGPVLAHIRRRFGGLLQHLTVQLIDDEYEFSNMSSGGQQQ